MNTLSPIGRALAAVSTLGMCMVIGNAAVRFSATTTLQWVGLLALWLVPAAAIVVVERKGKGGPS